MRNILMNDMNTTIGGFDVLARPRKNLFTALRAILGSARRANRPAARPALDY